MQKITIFTDGACSGNPGPGGWAAIVLTPDSIVRELGGGEPRTTNNRMELQAVIAALRAVRDVHEPIDLFTDSTYVISGITSWLPGWRRRGWLRSDGGQVLNRDVWEELDCLVQGRGKAGKVSWHYVRGHNGSEGNERCDAIAVSFSQRKTAALYDGPLLGYGVSLAQLPEEIPLPTRSLGRAKQKGGVYLSVLDGRLERHATWAECESRVKGRSGARFKKVRTPAEEQETLRKWGLSEKGTTASS